MKTIAIRGSAFAVGQQLGAFGREAWQTKIRQTALWQTVAALKTTEQTQRMRAAVQAQFPLIWQELEGMAEGLQAPVDECSPGTVAAIWYVRRRMAAPPWRGEAQRAS